MNDAECKIMRTLGLSISSSVVFLGPIIYASPTFVGKKCEFKESVLGHYCSVGIGSRLIFVRTGNYVTVGNNVSLNLGEHPIYEFSSSEAFCRSRIFPNHIADRQNSLVVKNGGHFSHTYVGHDVTIGDSVISTNNLDIGHGAIIKAGSLLSRSVPPYAIVEGRNRVIGQRCKDEVISDLLELKWWNYDLPAAKKQGMVIPASLADFVKWFKDTDLSNFNLSGDARLVQIDQNKSKTGKFDLSSAFFKWEVIGAQNYPSEIRESLFTPKANLKANLGAQA